MFVKIFLLKYFTEIEKCNAGPIKNKGRYMYKM